MTCTLGIDMVGYIMASRGVASIIASFISGHIGQKIHRNYQFAVALTLWAGVTATWLLWEPREDQLYAFFLIAIISGFVNSIDIVQFQGSLIHKLFKISSVNSKLLILSDLNLTIAAF